jgi:hypothetical protein
MAQGHWLATALLMLAIVPVAAEQPIAAGAATGAYDPGGGPKPFTGGPAFEPSRDPRDFEGTWVDKPTSRTANFLIGTDLPDTPQSRQIAAYRQQMAARGSPIASPHLTCRPTGIDATMNPKLSVIVMQTAQELIFITEEDRAVRHVDLKQPHPAKLVPTYMGHSAGHWEGNTLVVDTIGYNGLGWLDEKGTPHSDQLEVTERISKSADGSELDFDVTITDPKFYTRPFTVKRRWAWAPAIRPQEYDCEENPGETAEGIAYENELFRPVCVLQQGEGAAPSQIKCAPPESRAPSSKR